MSSMMGTGVHTCHGGGGQSGGLRGESLSSLKSELVSDEKCEGEDGVSEVELSEDGSLRDRDTEGAFE